jgi:uncharacterized protein YjbI with pentapeptide repeats
MDINSESLNLNNTKLGGQVATLNILKSNSDLSYCFLNSLEVVDKKIIQSKLDGSIIKNCKFKNTNLSRSDLNAVRVENCLFFNVDFSSTDIMSSIFSNCEFVNCNFGDAHISDCDFASSKFESSTFVSCSFLKSTIKDSSFSMTLFERSTNVLNKYYNTSFNNMSLGNCTFEYHIMKNCFFDSVTLNTDSLAYLYGCTMQQLNHINLIFLGNKIEYQNKIDVLFIDELFNRFVEKHWFLGAFLLKMNFNLTSIYNSLDLIIELFIKQNELGFLMKVDELQFLINIFYELKNNGELSILTLENYISKIETMSDNLLEKNKSLLLNLKNTAIQLKNIHEEELYALYNLLNKNRQTKAELIFKEKPRISPEQFFSDINNCYSIEIKIHGSREGSFIIEIVCGTVILYKIIEVIKNLTGNPIEIYKNGVVLKELIRSREFRKKIKKGVLDEVINKSSKEPNNKNRNNVSITVINAITISSASYWFPYLINASDSGGYGSNNLHKINIEDSNLSMRKKE